MDILTDYLSKSRSNYLRSREESLDLEVLKETRLDYFRMLLLKKSSFNPEDFKSWCIKNNCLDLYELSINDISYLEEKNILIKDSSRYKFTSNDTYKKLLKYQSNYIDRNELRIDLLSQVKNDEYFNKLTIELQNDFTNKILTQKDEIIKYLDFVSQNLTNTFGNTIAMYLQLKEKEQTFTMLRENSFWLNQKIEGSNIEILDLENDLKILKPIVKDNKVIAYSLKKYYDISQTNISLELIKHKKDLDYESIKIKLEDSIKNSNIFSTIINSNFINLELSGKEKIEYYSRKISEHYFFDDDERKLFNYLLLKSLNIDFTLNDFDLSNIKNKLSNVISTFNIVSTELLIIDIVNENKLEDLFYYKLGSKNDVIDENSIIDLRDREAYLVGNMSLNNIKFDSSIDIANDLLEKEEIKIEVNYENLFVSTKKLTILSGEYKNESFSLDSDYSDDEIKIIVARDFLSKIVEKNLLKNSIKIGDKNEFKRNKELFSREYQNNNRQLHDGISKEEISGNGKESNTIELSNESSRTSNGSNEQLDRAGDDRTRSMGNNKQRIDLSKIDNIPELYVDLFKTSDLSKFIHTKTQEELDVMTLNKRLNKSDFKSFNIFLSKNGIGYYSKTAKSFIIKDLDIINYFKNDKLTNNNKEKIIVSAAGIKINEKVNFNNKSMTFIGKNIYDADVYKDDRNVREYTENNGKIFISDKVSIIPGGNITISDNETKFLNGNFEFLTKEEMIAFSKDTKLINSIKVDAYKDILEDFGYLEPKFDKKLDELELNEYDSFLKENYSKMGNLDKNKYQDIIDSRLQARAQILAHNLGFGFDKINEWLEVAKFTESRNATNVIEMTVFGVKDQFKEIDVYLEEITKSSEYKNWNFTKLMNELIEEFDAIQDKYHYDDISSLYGKLDNNSKLFSLSKEELKKAFNYFDNLVGNNSSYKKLFIYREGILKENEESEQRDEVLTEIEQLNSLYLRKHNLEVTGANLEEHKIWNFIDEKDLKSFNSMDELSEYIRSGKYMELVPLTSLIDNGYILYAEHTNKNSENPLVAKRYGYNLYKGEISIMRDATAMHDNKRENSLTEGLLERLGTLSYDRLKDSFDTVLSNTGMKDEYRIVSKESFDKLYSEWFDKEYSKFHGGIEDFDEEINLNNLYMFPEETQLDYLNNELNRIQNELIVDDRKVSMIKNILNEIDHDNEVKNIEKVSGLLNDLTTDREKKLLSIIDEMYIGDINVLDISEKEYNEIVSQPTTFKLNTKYGQVEILAYELEDVYNIVSDEIQDDSILNEIYKLSAITPYTIYTELKERTKVALLSKDELEKKFKEHDSRLEVFKEYNDTYSLLLKQNIVLSVVIKEATSLENLNEFYKNFDMKNYNDSKGYYDESKHIESEFNEKLSNIDNMTKKESRKFLSDEKYDEQLKEHLNINQSELDNLGVKDLREKVKNKNSSLSKNNLYFTNIEYKTGLDWEDVTNYIPTLTIDSGVHNDGYIAMIDLNLNNGESLQLFYDEITNDYTFINENNLNIDILNKIGESLQSNYDLELLNERIINKKISIVDNLNIKNEFTDINFENDRYRIFSDTSIAEIHNNKIVNVLINKTLAEKILDFAQIKNKIKYSDLTNLPIGLTQANYTERVRSFEKQKSDMENGNLPVNEHTFKSLYDKLQYILNYENKNNIISKRSLNEINKFNNNNESHYESNSREQDQSKSRRDQSISTGKSGNISSSDEIEYSKRRSDINNGESINDKTSYFIDYKNQIKNVDNKKSLTDIHYKIRQDNLDEKITIEESSELSLLVEDKFNKLDELQKELHFKSICELRSKGNKNYINLLDDYNNKYKPISENEIVIDNDLLEKHRNISLKVLSSIYGEGKIIDSELNEHNKLFKDTLTIDDLDENFTIESEISSKRNGTKTKFKNYIAGIEIIRKIERNEEISIEDKVALSQMPGIGTIAQAFPRTNGTVAKGWEKESEELKAILSEDEYNQAARATLDAYYTDEFICKAMWKAIENFGYSGGSVLEPSMGIGNFFGHMPKHLKPNSQLIGIELDKTTAKVAQTLYPKARIYNIGFQDFKLLEGQKASIVIGNPPYGSHKIFDKQLKELDGMAIHNYFMGKSIDCLDDGGVSAMIVSSNFLDSKDPTTRAYIGKSANLIGAIRLPKGSFGNANTEIVTDIIFLQKRDYGMESNISEWLNISELNDTPINEYFVKNQEYLLGEWGKYGTMYRGDEPALIERPGQNTNELLLQAVEDLPQYINFHSGKKSYSKYPINESSISSSEKIIEFRTNDLAKTLARQKGEKMSSDARINSLFVNDDKIYKRYPDLNGETLIEEITTKINSKGEEKDLTEKEIEKIKGMIKIAEVANKLRYSQLDENIADSELDVLRNELNSVYDSFVKKHGYLNKSTNANLFEEDVNAPFLLALEKKYDKGISSTVAKKFGVKPMKESAVKADIFFKRTQTPYKMPTSAESFEDALHISLAEKTYVDMRFMSKLLNKEIEEIEDYLSSNGFIFNDPNYGWVTREEYLSGNVKQKYKETNNPKNLEALEQVIPEDIPAIDIAVACGASWIPQNDINDFVAEMSGDSEANIFYINYTASWNIADLTVSSDKENVYGTGRRSAKDIILAALNNKQITVYDKIEDGEQTRNVINQDETTAANDKVDLVKEAWNEWIWNTSDRRERLAKLYNDKFNVYAKREYDGSHLKFPGKVDDNTIELRPHQKNAVWRTLQNGRDLFDHTVGSGKTFSAIASVMELKRTGKARKPLIVVPNHLVSQWAKEWLELYPNANLLVPSKKDFTAKKRKLLMSRMATGEYDGIIIAHSQLIKIENDRNYEVKFLEDQIAQIHEAINQMREEKGKDGLSIKQWENKKDNLVSKMENLLSTPKDDNLNFLELGIDAMVVDEAHEFKNLQFHTSLQRIRGLGNPQGSQKAFDMYIKSQCLLEKTNNKNLIFLTGTPISNSIAEMYTVKRYLMSDELKKDGLEHFDAWAKQYAEIKTDWELSASGKYKLITRMSKFKNMPELIASYRTFADVITTQMVKDQLAVEGKVLDIPDVKGGKPKNVIVERSDDQANFIGVPDENGIYKSGTLVYRSENMPKGKPKKGDDNMLVVMSDAKKASLDMRLVDPAFSDFEGSKVNECINDLVNNYHKWDILKGAQLIFCDLSTPKGSVANERAKIEELVKKAEEGNEEAAKELDKLSPDEIDSILNSTFSVYDDVKEKLISKGIPENEIAFIHDAKTDLQKQELFLKVNSGQIRFLMGSTSKMGAGTNVQKRLVNLGHLDVPWRPSDLEQREGRIIRQGNSIFKLFKAIRENEYDLNKIKRNAKEFLDEFNLKDAEIIGNIIDLVRNEDGQFKVTINRYATKNTLDSGLWEKIEAKARFIQQLKNGDVLDREVEDISGEEANAAEMKAASSGNPLILEEMQLKTEIKKIEAVKKNFKRSLHDREERIKYYESSLEKFEESQNRYLNDIDKYNSYKTKMEVKKSDFEKLKQDNKNKGISNKDLTPVTDFEFVINDKIYDKREEVGAYIIKRARDLQYETKVDIKTIDVGKIADFDVSIEKASLFKETMMKLVISGSNDYIIDFDSREQKAIGIAVKMINELDRIKVNYDSFINYNSTITKELPKLKALPNEFPKEDELQLLKRRYKAVVSELQAKDTKQTNEVNNKETSFSSVQNNWIDDNKNIPTPILLSRAKLDLSVLNNINYEIVGKCLVLNNTLERKDYLKFQKIFETFGGIWDRKKDAIVFSEEGIDRIKDTLNCAKDSTNIQDTDDVRSLLKNKESELECS